MKRRLSVENRMLIEQLLRLNYKLKDIAYYVDSTSSTVSREIQNRRIIKTLFSKKISTKRFFMYFWVVTKPTNYSVNM